MAKKKLVGRLGIEVSETCGIDRNYVRYRLFLRVHRSEYGYLCLNFSAQANENSPEYTYALGCDGINLGDYDSLRRAELLATLVKKMRAETALRPAIYDGRAEMHNSDVHQLAQAVAKMGVEVRFFREPNKAYDWSADSEAIREAMKESA